MRHLDSEALASFVAVAETGAFTAAAERLGKTQAAVSISVARLEDRLGKRLFDRSSRGTTLTAAGETLIVYARQIHSLETEAITLLTGRDKDARILIGMPDDYVNGLGGAVLERFAREQRHTPIDIRCDYSRDLERKVSNGEIDLAIITQNPDRPRGIFLRHERQFFCTGPNGRAGQAPSLNLALFSEANPSQPSISALLEQHGRPYRIAHRSSHLSGIIRAAASGEVLTVLPEPAIPADWRRFGVEDGLPELPLLRLALLVRRNEGPAVRRVVGFLRREFGEPADDTDGTFAASRA